MRMIFTDHNKVTIVNVKGEFTNVKAQTIADYCTEDVIGNPIIATQKQMNDSKARRDAEHREAEATMLLTYLPFVKKIVLNSKQTILIRIFDEDIVELRVSKELCDFLNSF